MVLVFLVLAKENSPPNPKIINFHFFFAESESFSFHLIIVTIGNEDIIIKFLNSPVIFNLVYFKILTTIFFLTFQLIPDDVQFGGGTLELGHTPPN